MGGWCQLAGAAVAIYLIPKSCETERWLVTSYLAIHLITAPVSRLIVCHRGPMPVNYPVYSLTIRMGLLLLTQPGTRDESH